MDKNVLALDWALVHSFLAVAETGSLSGAARSLGITQPTVGRQIATMETQLGVTLFERRARGMAPTDTALALLPAAEAMRDGARALSLAAAGQSAREGGTVRITASIFASHHILPPILARLRRDAPEIALELVPSDTTENLLFREADIAVRMYRPRQLDVVTRHIGDIDIAMFAAKGYLADRPESHVDTFLETHEFVGFDRNEDIIRGFRDLGIGVDREFFATRCDHQTTYWELVRAGCGIGFAQARVGRQDPAVVELDLPMKIPALEVWLAAPSVLRKRAPIARVWDALAEGLAQAVDRPTHRLDQAKAGG
ncbi:MAG: LysR family transcriptional regulator [Pseudomonadota bacterium]